MKVYLAGPYAARERLRAYAAELRSHGIDVTSSWLDEVHEINSHTTGAATGLADDQVDGHARTDLADINRSHVLVLFTASALDLEPAQAGSGGRHVETGYALATGKKVIVVGNPENVFHRLTTVERYEDWTQTQHRLIALEEAGTYYRRPLRGYPA